MIQGNKAGKPRRNKPSNTLPDMTDESGKSYRDRLIASGQITAYPLEFRRDEKGALILSADGKAIPLRPTMSKQAAQNTRMSWINSGFLMPKTPEGNA